MDIYVRGTKRGGPGQSATGGLLVDRDVGTVRLPSGHGSLENGRDVEPKVIVLVGATLFAAPATPDATISDASGGSAVVVAKS